MFSPASTCDSIVRLPSVGKTGHRAHFGTFDPETGREITSTWYSDLDELIKDWAGHGFLHVETTDNRILRLEQITSQLRSAFEAGGSDGVTEKLAQIEFERAKDELQDVQIGVEAQRIERLDATTHYAFNRSLSCDLVVDPEFDNWHIVGLEYYVQFTAEFPPSCTDEVPPAAGLLNQQFTTSYSAEKGLTPSLSDFTPSATFSGFEVIVDAGAGQLHGVSVNKDVFTQILTRHKASFKHADNLPSTAHKVIRNGEPSAPIRSRSRGLQRDLDWLKKVAGITDEYIARWPESAWETWHQSMHARAEDHNPAVPGWLQEVIRDDHRDTDFSVPFPVIATVIGSLHNWFEFSHRHPELDLAVARPVSATSPELSVLQSAHSEAQTHGWQPRLSLQIVPGETSAELVGVVEAFYIVAPKADSAAVEALFTSHGFPSPTREPVMESWLKLTHAETDACVVWASEWLQ